MKLTPSRRLYVLGIVMLAALTICSRKFGSMGAPSFLIPLAVAGIAYLFAIREFFSTPRFPRRVDPHRARVGCTVACCISDDGARFG